MKMQSPPPLKSAVEEATNIVAGIQALAENTQAVAVTDSRLQRLADLNRHHPRNGQLTSCHVIALYQVGEASRISADWPRARQMLARLDAVIATIPDDGDVTVGTSGGQTITGKNLLMTGLLNHVVGCVAGIEDFEAAMAWLQKPNDTLDGETPMDRVNQRHVADVLDAVMAARA